MRLLPLSLGVPTLVAIVGFTFAQTPSSSVTAMSANSLLHESSLPYRLPPFDLIKDEHFEPAFEAGMAAQLAEIEAIATQTAAPTFDNTIVALERSGQLLTRVQRVFYGYTGTITNPALQTIESALAPKLAAQSDALRLNPAIFARIDALHRRRASLALDAESAFLLERYHKDFVRAGARLSDTDKAALRAFNAELASLQTTFAQNVLKESNAAALIVDTRAELAGLSDSAIASAASAAKAAGQEGRFALRLLNTSGQPALASLENREVRKRLLDASLARNRCGGEFDNRAIVVRIARLRAERAALLVYPSHAAYQLEDQTAGDVDTVNRLLAQLAPPAVANAHREAAAMQTIIDADGAGFPLAAWDWAFYAEKVRSARYAFDETQLRPYLEAQRVLVDGVFFSAGKLFGITFKERPDLPVYHPDVRVYEVFDADGRPLGLCLVDLFTRPSKRGGAWMNNHVSQSKLLGLRPVVGVHMNVPKPPDGEPALLTADELKTLFHEFGHAFHGLFSDVRYPRFSGTAVPRDFVEFPSQIYELWSLWPEVLRNFAKHHRTGEIIPAALVEKLLATESFNEGFRTTEYLAAALLDQAWHQLKPADVPADPVAFELNALAKAGVALPAVPPRYRSAYFSHVFSGGYSAGYYSYIWSEVLDAQSVDWLKARSGLTRANGDHLRATVLSRGGSADALAMFRAFTGAAPDIAPLLKRRGLEAAPVPTQP